MKVLQNFCRIPLNAEIGVKPSVYVNELLMSPGERQKYLVQHNDCIRLFSHAVPASTFEKWDVRPRIIFFNNWRPKMEYEVCFTIRNKYRCSKLLKLDMGCSEIFELEEMKQIRRLASMVTAQYKVKFKPLELTDYEHSITVHAENESFPLYILALGPRPIIDFPDKIDFGDCLVNFKNEKVISLKNIGEISATVIFESIGSVFVVQEKLTLAPREHCCINVQLMTKKASLYNAQIIATYETGEKVYINVTANCKRGKIYLENTEVQLERTYIGLKYVCTMVVHNDTEHILDFSWLRNQNLDLDINEWKKLCRELKDLNNLSKRKLAGLRYLDIVNEAEHESALNRVLQDEISEFQHKFYFVDSCIHIEPCVGSVWPKSTTKFNVIFEPTQVMIYKTIAFLELTGLDNRLKVTLQGEAIGPKLSLNVSTINFGKCFISSSHSYGVIVRNLGLIKGKLKYLPGPTICGGQVTCEPSELELLPDETKLVEIQMISNTAGLFVEDVWFQIEESSEKLRCILKGEIINPRLILDTKKLDFGQVALGFRSTKTFTITNSSPIPVEIRLKVEGDGYMEAVLIDIDYDHMLPPEPQEFTIKPNHTIIASEEVLTVEVALIANKMRKHKTTCNVYFLGVRLDDCSLVTSYETKYPAVVSNPKEIVMRYAFTDYEYLHKLTVCNESELPTYFSFLPQQNVFNPYLIYRLENASGFLMGKTCVIVKVYVKVLTLKPCKERIKMRVFGQPYFINACTIRAYGMGPVVNPSSFTLNWGKVKLLEEVEKTVSLINVSPITAYYKITVVKNPDVWRTLEKEGSIQPNKSTEVTVIARLKDGGKISDKIWVEIAGSRDIYITLIAYGYGMSILTEPNLFPLYDMGKVFRREKHIQTIKITNFGSREHILLFSTMNEIKKMTKMKAAEEQGTCFKLNPYRLNLCGGESQDITLSYKWDEEAVLEDTYYCYAIINNQGKRIILGTCTIRATFTDPEFYVEPPEVHFRIDISHFDKEVGPICQNLKLTSLWGSKLCVECKLNSPFSFGNTPPKSKNIQYLELEPHSEHQLLIMFDPPNLKSRLTKVCNDVLQINYKGHTVKTFINLIGEVNFPNIMIQTKLIDFKCIAPNSEGVYQVHLRNVSPLTVEFDWAWDDNNIIPLKQVPGFENIKRNDFPMVHLLETSKKQHEQNEPEQCEEMSNSDESFTKNLNTRNSSKALPIILTEKRNLDRDYLIAKNIHLPKNLPTLIRELFTRKYFFQKDQQVKEDDLEPEKHGVLVDYETQFTGRVAFYASLLNQGAPLTERSSSSCRIRDSFESLESGDLPDSLKEGLGIRSSLESHDLSLNELMEDLRNEEILKTHNEFKLKSHMQLMSSDEVVPHISKIIDINPCQGTLQPQDSLILTFTFSPRMPMSVEGTAVCRILGGPEEMVEVKGTSFQIQYEVLPTDKINFGFGPFCELWCSSFFVWNKSLKEVHVSLTTTSTTRGLKQEEEDTSRLPESVCIYPSSLTVKPFQVSYHRVAVFPGRVGEINLPIHVQVDNEEPVYIHFVGYAMPHQIHFKIPHKIQPKNDLEIYKSIGRMTTSWFKLDLKDQIDITVSSTTLINILKEIQKNCIEDDWDLLMTENDLVPTIDDINMGYERYLCENYCAQFQGPLPVHIPCRKGCEILPYFMPDMYTADFGFVIAGTKALYGIPYSNYCPITTTVQIVPPDDKELLDKFGVVFKLVNSQQLAGYEEKRFDIFIRPPIDIIRKTGEAVMTFDFNFRVTCGANIPVTVKALITQPLLQAPKLIDFEGVKLGYCRIMKFKLKNLSKVDCEWFAILWPPEKPDFDCCKAGKVKSCPFVVKPVYGYLYPKRITVISVIFEPKYELPFEVDILFVANMSTAHARVRLRGYGLEPKLLIRPVSFGYSIPYSQPLKKHFTVYNPNLFPVDIFIYGKDKKWTDEQKIFKYLLDYYGDKRIFVPSCFFTTRMTERITNMFQKLAVAAIKKHIEDTSSYLCIVIQRHFLRINEPSSDNILTKKQSKRTVKKTTPRNWKPSYNPLTAKKKKTQKIQRKGEDYNIKVAEIEAIIWDHLPKKSLTSVIEDYIEFVKCFDIPCKNLADEESLDLKIYKNSEMKNRNIIILHHSPNSYPELFSWLINKHTGMVPISIDQEIYAEIKEGKTEESFIVRDILYNYYLQEKIMSKMTEKDKVRFSTIQIDSPKIPIKEMKELLNFAIFKSKPKRNDPKTKLSRESTTTQKSIKLNVDKNEVLSTLVNIPRNVLESIIKRRLSKRIKHGLIIKSLSSKFFSNSLFTLEVLLNIFREYRNLNVVSLYSTPEACMRIDKRFLNLQIIENFEKLTGINIIDAPISLIRQMGNYFYDQRKGLNKMMPTASKKTANVKATKRKSPSKSPSLSKVGRRRSKQKMTSNLKIIEIEYKFMNYYKELEKIRSVLCSFDRTKEFNVADFDFKATPKKTGLNRNNVLPSPIFRIIPKVDDNIGVPLWILNNFPYSEDYQFSTYAKLLSSIDSICTKPKEKETVKQKRYAFPGKSYYIIERTNQFKPFCEDSSNEPPIFHLKPIIKRPKIIKHSRLFTEEEDEVYPSKYSSRNFSITTSGSSANIAASSVGINSLMYTIVMNNLERTEASLLEDLELFLNEDCKSDQSFRQLIKPSRFKSWEVNFAPRGCCEFVDYIPFGISGCSAVKYISIFAGCDIPDISFNPQDVFPAFDADVGEIDLFDIIKPCYLKKRNLFHFGVNIVQNFVKDRHFLSKVPLTFTNTSHIVVRMNISIINEKKHSRDKDLEKHQRSQPNLPQGLVKENQHKKRSAPVISTRITRSTVKKKGSKSYRSGKTLFDEAQYNVRHTNISNSDPFVVNMVGNKKKKTVLPSDISMLPDYKCFNSESSHLSIEVGEKKIIDILAQPLKTGLWNCMYMFSIENNPKVYTLQAFCCGIAAHISFHPKELHFDEVILYRSATLCFSMENTSKVPLLWKIHNTESFKPQIVLSKHEGLLKPDEVDAVYITYYAREVEKIAKNLTVGVSALEHKDIELQEHTYHLVLKSYSVDVNFYFELCGNNHLELGDIGVGWDVASNIVIGNNGTNPILFKLSINENEMKSLENLFTVSIDDNYGGLLKSEEVTLIKATLSARGEVSLSKMMFLVIEIADYYSEDLISRIPGYISFQSHFPKFILSPSQILDFGDIEVGTLKILELNLENVGTIDFSYSISTVQVFSTPIKNEDFEGIASKNIDKQSSHNISRKHDKNSKTVEFYIGDVLFLKKTLFLQKHNYRVEKASQKLKIPLKNCSRKELKRFVSKRNKINSIFKINNRIQIFKKIIKASKSSVSRINNNRILADSKVKFEDKLFSKSKSSLFISKRTNKKSNKTQLDGGPSTMIPRIRRSTTPPFQVDPNEGLLKSQMSSVISVYCFSQTEGLFERKYLLAVKNASPETEPIPLYMTVKFSIPKVSFDDYESMFSEFVIDDNWHRNNNGHVYNKGLPFGFFSRNKIRAYFCNVIVGCSATFNIYFRSQNHLAALVEVAIIGEYDNTFNINNYDGGKVYIPSYECSSIPITFSPKTLETYKATAVLTLKAQSNYIVKRSIFTLSGVGHMPVLELSKILTADDKFSFHPKCDFGYVHVNTSERKLLTLTNVGTVIAETLFEFPFKTGFFLLHCSEEILKTVINETCFDGEIKPTTLFRINPGQEISFEIEFCPTELGSFSSSLIVHLVYNPFEVITIKLFGESYRSEIELSGPNIVLLPKQNYFSGSMDQFKEYELNFGMCVSEKKYIKKFYMTNNTDVLLRFEYDCLNNHDILIIPSVGHLYQSSKKKITAILLASTVGDFSADISCHFESIIYKAESVSWNQWDNSMKMITWLEDTKASLDVCEFHYSRLTEAAEEPEYTNSSYHDSVITIYCRATVDVPSITSSSDSLGFATVLVGQAAERIVKFTNESNVDYKYFFTFGDEISTSSDPIPNLVSFTFGRFDYNLNNLPEFKKESLEINVDTHWPLHIPEELEDNLDISIYEIFRFSSEIWEDLKCKHLSIIYERPVTKPLGIVHGDSISCRESGLNLSQQVSEYHEKSLSNVKISQKSLPHKSDLNLLNQKNNYNAFEDTERESEEKSLSSYHEHGNAFAVDTMGGIIKPKETIECKVTFLPRHIQSYEAYLKFINKDTNEENVIFLHGTGFLPLCHIEIEENNYLNEVGSTFPSIPVKTKAVVIRSMDSNEVTKKLFNVYNITEIPFHFKWYCIKKKSPEHKIVCHSSEGIIPPRGRFQMLFSFCAAEYGVFESLWVLCFKEFNLQQVFLFVGIAKEPQVDVDPKTIVLKPVLQGMKSSAYINLANFEDSEVKYAIIKGSLLSCFNCSESLYISPMKGKIMPKDSITLEIEFNPQIMKEQLFNPQIEICSTKKIIPFKVVSKSFSILAELICTKDNFEKIFLQPRGINNENTITIGKINVRMPYSLTFVLKNLGEIPFYFECFLPEKLEEGISIDIKNKQGVVLPSKEIMFQVLITALERVCFKQPFSIKMTKGPDYCMVFTGNAVTPICRFSFDSYDFGICLIQDSDPLKNSVVLEFYNLDSDPVLLETKGCKEAFCVNFQSLIIEPRATHKILIIFNPTKPKKYFEVLKFFINNYFQNEILLAGEGDYLKLEIKNPEDRLIDFGPVKAGKTVSRNVPVVNRSRTMVEFSLHAHERNDEKSNAKLMVEPTKRKILLESGAICNVKVSFHATEKLKIFKSTVTYKAYGTSEVFFLVTASVINYEFSFDQTHLIFGPTTIGCSTTLKVGLVNSGDIGTRFNLETKFVSDVFVVKPLQGYSPPGSTTVIEVTFVPNCIMQYCNNMLVCVLKNYHSLNLAMTAVGAKIPLPVATVKFITKVRQQGKESVVLYNRSLAEQILHPVVEGEYFSGADTIVIPPQSAALYEILYYPLTQTKNIYHLGSVFVSYCSGEGQLYKLMGIALPPKYTQSFRIHCIAKVKKCVKIPIENWSSSSETFSVSIEVISIHPLAYFEIEASDTVCLLPKQHKIYILRILIFKECKMTFRVIFRNINSGEYSKYKITVISGACIIPWPVKLTSYVREKVCYKMLLYNPMEKAAVFVFQSPHPNITPSRKKIKVKPHKKAFLKFWYLPLKAGQYETVKVEASNYLLGKTIHNLDLEAITPRVGEEYTVQAYLGIQEKFALNIKNLTSSLMTCFPLTKSSDLTFLKSSFNVPRRKLYKMEVLYLPSQLGVQLMNINVRTNKMGTLSFQVKGICHPPKPQGPFILKKKGSFKLNFQNVLSGPANFFCDLNNTEFQSSIHNFSLSPGESQLIEVEFVKIKQSSPLLDNQPSSCKLTVSCSIADGSLIHWIYYLKSER